MWGGRDHPDRQCPRAPHAGGVRLELSDPGASDDASQTQGQGGPGTGQGDRPAGTEKALWPIPHPDPGGQERQTGVRGDRP